MSSSVLTIRSPSLFTMSQSQLNHTYDTNQKKNTMNIPESKQSILNIQSSSSSSSKQRNANHNHNHQNHHNKNNNNSKKNNNGDDHNHTNDNHGGTNHNSSSFSTPYNHIQPHSSGIY